MLLVKGCVISMHKIAVLGSRDTIIGFKALGLEVFQVTEYEEALSTFISLTSGSADYAIIYVEESFAEALSQEIEKHKDRPTPAVILIPGREGSIGLGQAALKAAVERAVGSDIL